MVFVKFLLYPFTCIYWLLTGLRNWMYDKGFRKSFRFDIITICVGNLSVGGTGKTPMVEYLIRLLNGQHKLAVLSRGYGRKTRGFILAEEGVSAMEIGDEPYQYFAKFKDKVSVAVGEERALAIPSILLERPETQVIVLDDAFQHRTVIYDLNIVLTDYNKLFYKDMLLPAGRLRESGRGISRAQVAVVSKSPATISEEEKTTITTNIRNYAGKKIPVFFTTITYGTPENVFPNSLKAFSKNVYLFTGIANNIPLIDYLQTKFVLLGNTTFSDHHNYSEKDLVEVMAAFMTITVSDKCLVTTEKDMAKLTTTNFGKMLENVPVYYIPIETTFLNGQEQFNEYVLNFIRKNNN